MVPSTQLKLKYPEWQTAVQELILEFDGEKLREKVPKMQKDLIERLERLPRGNGNNDEALALQDALSVLRLIINSSRVHHYDISNSAKICA